MKNAIVTSSFFVLFCLAGSQATASTPINDCPDNFATAAIDVTVSASTIPGGCPLLEDNELRPLIDELFPGTVFAHPTVQGTCLSGEIITGTITTEFEIIDVRGTTESAQRLFNEAFAVNPSNMGLFIIGESIPDNTTFLSGAAVTVASLVDANNENRRLTLVMSDRFSVKPITSEAGLPAYLNTEDLEIVESVGANAKGRLTGTVVLDNPFPPFADLSYNVQGQFCLQ